MTSSQSGQPSSGAFAFPALPKLSQRPETIVNPEGRTGEGSGSIPASAQPRSSVWQRLFPQAPGSSDDSLDEPLSPEGFELGHFVLEERIGIGGMGAVFRATDTRLQRIVALKVLGPAQSRDESSVKRFQNEASAAARLDHENIARVFFIGEDQGLHYIAFEYITGTNLRDLIREKGPLPPIDAVNFTLQIATALNHTYAAGVVHRDIKPSNIIVMPNGRAKLVDLGLARKQNSDSVTDLTMAGTTLGTFDYISPEQAKDPRTADVRSDIYSLGCTLYHALTGGPPYPEGTVLQKLLDHQGKEAPDPILKNRQIPFDLSFICRKMMASDPKQRYANPEAVVRDLMPLAVRMGLKGMPADGLIWRHITPPKQSFWEKNFGWLASVAALLLIVFLVWRFPTLGSAGDNDSLTDRKPSAPPDFTGTATPGERTGDVQDQTASEKPDDLVEPEPIGTNAPNPADLVNAPDEPSWIDLVSGKDDSASNENEQQDSTQPPENPLPDQKSPGEYEAPALPAETGIRPFWVIRNDGSNDEAKRTLEAACKAAGDGQIVEIRHNGLLTISRKKSIQIQNKRLTIRAGEGFRPLLRFAGVETDAEESKTKLFGLSNASLDLIDLDFHLAPDSGVTLYEDWALAAMEGGGRVLLQGVTVTVDDQEQGLASIVELLPASGSPTMNNMKMMKQENDGRADAFEIRVSGSFLRGGCHVFHTRHTLPGRIEIEQSAIAVEGALLKAEGDLDMKSDQHLVEMTLNHTTCLLVGNSLILFDSGDIARDLLPVVVRDSRHNLIATNTSSPLISMFGESDPEIYQKLLRWDGQKNFYDGFDVYWEISSSQPEQRAFESWLKASGITDQEAHNGGIYWSGEWMTKDLTDITGVDLRLDPSDNLDNPAVGGAADKTDVGVDLTKLPPLPEIDRTTGALP